MRSLLRGVETICFEPNTGANGAATTAAPAAPAPAAPVQQAAPVGTDGAAIVGALVPEIQRMVTAAVAPLVQNQTTLTQRLDQLTAPNTQRQQQAASLLFGAPGAAPGIRTGEDPLTSRGYQYYRAIGFRQGALSQDQCKVELDVHTQLWQHMRQNGFVPQGINSILVPLSSSSIPGLDDRQQGEMRQMLRQGVTGMDPEATAIMLQSYMGGRQVGGGMTRRQALSMWDDTGLGVLLGSTQMGELIELLRNKEIFSRAGASEITLPPNGRIQFPKQTAAGTAYWVGESATITSSQPQTGYLDLIAKKLAVLTKLPNELLTYGSPSVEAFIRNDNARIMALEADNAMLTGVGSTVKVKGLLNYSGVTTRVAGVTGNNGDTLQPEDLGLMLGDVEQFNHDVESLGWSWVCRPQYAYAIYNKRASVYNGTSTATLGEFMFHMNRDNLDARMPMQLLGYPLVKSNQVPNTYSKGSGSNLTRFIGGCFAHWMVARIGVLEFATSVQGDTAFTTDQTWVRAIQHLDAAPRYEDAFVFVDTLLPTV